MKLHHRIFTITAEVHGYDYEATVERKTGELVDITAGCRTWDNFKEARRHYRPKEAYGRWSKEWIAIQPEERRARRDDALSALRELRRVVKKWRRKKGFR